jgi:hypothetical protein
VGGKMTKEKDNIEEAVIKQFRTVNIRHKKLGYAVKRLAQELDCLADEMEDLHDLTIAYGRFDEPRIPWEEVKRRLHVDDEDKDYDWPD